MKIEARHCSFVAALVWIGLLAVGCRSGSGEMKVCTPASPTEAPPQANVSGFGAIPPSFEPAKGRLLENETISVLVVPPLTNSPAPRMIRMEN